MKHSIPAIPEGGTPPSPLRLFELTERVTVFDEEDRKRLKRQRGHYPKCDYEGQVSLFE